MEKNKRGIIKYHKIEESELENMSKDHKYAPNGILKRFGYSDIFKQNMQIYRMNLCKDIIESIDTFDNSFVEEDFFEEDLDVEIRKKVEDGIGELYTKISRVENYELNNKVKIMKWIWIIQYFRKEKYINKCGKIKYNNMMKSISNRFLDTNLLISDEKEIKELYNIIDKKYNEYIPGYIKIIKTNRTFILPFNQFAYIFPETDYEEYIYPIGKDVALIWKKKTVENTKFPYVILSDSKMVEKINIAITMSELKNNKSGIFYGAEEELLKIKEIYNTDT